MGKAALPAFLQPASQCGGKVCTGNLSPGLVSALPMAMTVTVGKSLPFPETQFPQLYCEGQPREKLFREEGAWITQSHSENCPCTHSNPGALEP